MGYIYINIEIYDSGHISRNLFKDKKNAIANAKKWIGWKYGKIDKLKKIQTYRIYGIQELGWSIQLNINEKNKSWELINEEVSEH